MGRISMRAFIIIELFLAMAVNVVSAAENKLEDCQNIVSSKLCLTNYIEYQNNIPQLQNIKLSQERKCETIPEEIKQYFLEVYSELPLLSQRLICNLERIYIEKGAPYAGLVDKFYDLHDVNKNSKQSTLVKVLGHFMSINLDARITKKETCAAAELRRFSSHVADGNSELINSQISFEVNNDNTSCDLYSTLLHESGHVLDFSNNYFSSPASDWFKFSFVYLPDDTNDTIAAIIDPIYVKKYDDGLLLIEDIPKAFQSIYSSSFVSFYATTDAAEDFAELYTLIMSKYPKKIILNGVGSSVDLLNNNELFKQKTQFIKNQMNSDSIKMTVVPFYILLI